MEGFIITTFQRELHNGKSPKIGLSSKLFYRNVLLITISFRPDIDELIAAQNVGGQGIQKAAPAPPAMNSKQSSSFSHHRQPLQTTSSQSLTGKRPQYLVQNNNNKNGESPLASHSDHQHIRDRPNNVSKPYSSSFHHYHHSSLSNDTNGPAKRRKPDGSPSGTPHSSGSGGSATASLQHKAISQMSDALIQQVRHRFDTEKSYHSHSQVCC